MPRQLAPALDRMLRRANPHVATFVELSAPDQAAILRRAPDQLLAPPSLVSMTPAASAVASPQGALTLSSAEVLLVNQFTDTGIYNIPQEDGGDTLLHTVAWQLDRGFGGCVLTSVTVLLHWTSGIFLGRPNVRLQIYRASQVAGVLQRNVGSSLVETKLTQVSFAPLLPEPVLLRYADLVLAGVVNAGTGFGTVTFDLTQFRLQIDPVTGPPPGPDKTGDLPEIYFSITTDQQSPGNLVEWRRDASSPQVIAGVGDVRELTWTRSDPNDPTSVWTATETGGAMTFKLGVEQYVATSQEAYALTLPALPDPASIGRVVFSKGTPTGTAATMELGEPSSIISGAVLAMSFDDDTPTDRSGAGNNGILRNGPTFAAGKIGRAVVLDGLNDYVEVPSVPALKFTGGDLTLAAWVWLDAADATLGFIFSKPWNGSGEYNYQLLINTTDTLSLRLLGAGGTGLLYTLTSPGALSTAAWHHVVATVDAAKNTALWIDGVRVATGAHAFASWVPSLGDISAPLCVGTLYPYGGAWAGDVNMALKGMLDDPRIYTRVLSDAEIVRLAAGEWLAVADGDVVTVPAKGYPARVTLTPSADLRRAPIVSALGVEFRDRIDLSPESTVEHMSQDVSLPFLQASVGEGRITGVKTGRRDYVDPATEIAVAGPDTQLEVDTYLASRHPAITRADWFLLSRASVSNRTPGPASESFSTLSIAKRLKRKIPTRVESINRVHTVVAATTTQVTLSGLAPLAGATAAGNEYDAQNYYIRVRKSAVVGVETGTSFTISGNTGTNKLDFIGVLELPAAFAAGDELEVHSGVFVQPSVSWIDQDPADVWLELATLHAGFPISRIGLADVGVTGRGGFPPRVTDRAPGDPATQAKLLVTMKLTEAELCDELMDQVSFLMGGTTVEIAGQLVYRQIYPLRDANGVVVVAPDPVAAVFDARDLFGLDTPTGREARITVLACNYGVNATGANPAAPATVNYVDVDALTAYETQDVEGLGFAEVPDKIARWCYCSADGGRYLAEHACKQVVLAASTGLRVWPFAIVDAHPELTVGDTVVVVTDQYTDFNPATGRPIRGWNAYPLTLVGTSEGGRRFRGFLQGLADVSRVTLKGGQGTVLEGDATEERFQIRNVRQTDTDTTVTIFFDTDAPEIWASYLVIDIPEVEADVDRLAAAIAPLLPAGTRQFTVPKPLDKQLTVVRIDALLSDVVVADSLVTRITGTPQLPHWEWDDFENYATGIGTLWGEYTERGIALTTIEFQTQIGSNPISDFAPPARVAGAMSLVPGRGILGPRQIEMDVPLDTDRTSWIVPRERVENTTEPLILGWFGFDRDKNPKLIEATVTGTKIRILGDVDTKSIKVEDLNSAWEYAIDGPFALIDVALVGTNGVAGLGASATSTYQVTAYSARKADVDGSTLTASRNVVVGGPSAAPPAATFVDVITVVPDVGNTNVRISLQVTSVIALWTVKIAVGESTDNSNVVPVGDFAAGMVPSAVTPTATMIEHVFSAANPRVAGGPDTKTVYLNMRVDLCDGAGVVQDTRPINTGWETPA